MAVGKPVVSTTVGAEGLDVHHGRDIMLADDARSFAQAVIALLRDPDMRRRYQTAAAATAARYDWPAIGERFSEVLPSVAAKRSLSGCAESGLLIRAPLCSSGFDSAITFSASIVFSNF